MRALAPVALAATAAALLLVPPSAAAGVAGEVEIMWVDAGGVHVRDATVAAAGGVAVLYPGDGDGADDGLAEQAWRILWPAWLNERAIATARAKYDVERYAGPRLLGRPTGVVDIRHGGWLRERLYTDRATDLVLRRELFDDNGRLRRSVTFERLGDMEAGGARVRKGGGRPAPAPEASPPFPAPRELDGGYRRVGAYRHEGRVQVVYSDGVYGLSVFAQRGRLTAGSLPPGGRVVQVGDREGHHYTWAAGEVVLWQDGEAVYTAVSDAPAGEVLVAARSMPPGPSPGVIDRLRRVCSGLLGAFVR